MPKIISSSEEIVYKCKLTSEISKQEKEGFVSLFNEVFNQHYSMAWFEWKYIENIYGDSYIVLAHCGDKLVGIRSFWRNDIDGNLCYQPCDTAVHRDFRGRSIFSAMSRLALEKTKDSFIYNFPNHQALPANLKLGWEVNKYCYLKFVVSKSNLLKETRFIEDNYLVWKFGKSHINEFFYHDIKGVSYLLFRRKNNFYYVLGRFNSKYETLFTKASIPILFNYCDEETTFYKLFKNRSTIVYYKTDIENVDEIDIPMFKADFF